MKKDRHKNLSVMCKLSKLDFYWKISNGKNVGKKKTWSVMAKPVNDFSECTMPFSSKHIYYSNILLINTYIYLSTYYIMICTILANKVGNWLLNSYQPIPFGVLRSFEALHGLKDWVACLDCNTAIWSRKAIIFVAWGQITWAVWLWQSCSCGFMFLQTWSSSSYLSPYFWNSHISETSHEDKHSKWNVVCVFVWFNLTCWANPLMTTEKHFCVSSVSLPEYWMLSQCDVMMPRLYQLFCI